MPGTVTLETWPEQPVPEIPQAQLDLLTPENVHLKEVGSFDPVMLAEFLRNNKGARVLGIDLGGGSVRAALLEVGEDGTLAPVEGDEAFVCETEPDRKGGEGFLKCLEDCAKYAKDHGLIVGMSYGGPLNGTKPLRHPKIKKFARELQQKYGGDLQKVFEGVDFAVENDGPLALVSCVMRAVEEGDLDPAVVCLINGGGLGIGGYNKNILYSTEAGHAPVAKELNKNKVRRRCGLYGAHTCLENVISNKQGLVPQWRRHTGYRWMPWVSRHKHVTGKEIEDFARGGDPFAMELYEQVAVGEAALMRGVEKVLKMDPRRRIRRFVHGGAHRTPNLTRRIAQIVSQNRTPGPEHEIWFTERPDKRTGEPDRRTGVTSAGLFALGTLVAHAIQIGATPARGSAESDI